MFTDPKKLSKKKKKELDKKNRIWYDYHGGGVHKSKKDYNRQEVKKEVKNYDE